MYKTLFQRILYPAYETFLCRRKTLRYLANYQRSQWMTPDEIAASQWAKLRELLIYCYEHVPYYKAQWDRMGIHWQDNGRELDTIHTRAGHAVPGAFFPYMFKEAIVIRTPH